MTNTEETPMLRAVVETLTFYADQRNYISPSSGFEAQVDPKPALVAEDCGQRARHALRTIMSLHRAKQGQKNGVEVQDE